ncbi:excisionase [Anaerosporobacter sp.]|uniref:excisionase n=1 Tax=Anaerosporobacter sp. TaxID=1872529 RepID=UPI00286F934F|nr:excisionase [Anaerosporobacter sp.]
MTETVLEDKGYVPIWEKFALTINEATQYFNLGEKKIRKLAEDYVDYGFVVQNGAKTLIKRMKFEEFMNETNSV